MELLEIALKQSIAWSLSQHDELPFGKAASKKSDDKTANISEELLEGVESANFELQRESQMRAFVSRFMIELNQLVERFNEPEDSLASSNGATVAMDTGMRARELEGRAKRVPQPTIEMNGKYSGVYNINGTQTTDEDEDFDEAYMRHMQLVYDAFQEGQNSRQHPMRSSSGRRRSRHVNESHHQIDDGYRSLSRDGSTTNTMKRDSRRSDRSLELLKQLNDIKSRVVDLMRQLDDIAAPKLDEQDLDTYRRRRDALVQKLDALIVREAGFGGAAKEDGLDSSNQLATSADSSQSSSSDSYEEQIQVIDYDFKRRASDLGEIRRSRGSVGFKKPVEASLKAPEQNLQTQMVLNEGARNASTKIKMGTFNAVDSSRKLFPECQAEPIDFSAMMSDYEKRKKANDENGIHMPSSSSASSGSNTSTTASSYI